MKLHMSCIQSFVFDCWNAVKKINTWNCYIRLNKKKLKTNKSFFLACGAFPLKRARDSRSDQLRWIKSHFTRENASGTCCDIWKVIIYSNPKEWYCISSHTSSLSRFALPYDFSNMQGYREGVVTFKYSRSLYLSQTILLCTSGLSPNGQKKTVS